MDVQKLEDKGSDRNSESANIYKMKILNDIRNDNDVSI